MDLISIHIPKTAGTSFRNTLQEEYGANNVKACYKGVGANLTKENIGNIKCLHGHITPEMFIARFPEAKVITWVRDPLERIKSYYYYNKYTRNDGVSRGMQKYNTFMDWVNSDGSDYMINEISPYLNLDNIKLFDFIGFVDNYDNELKRLSDMMGWKPLKKFTTNKSNKKENIILSEDDMNIIKKKFHIEYELYEVLKNK